jgi:hypothetical protein
MDKSAGSKGNHHSVVKIHAPPQMALPGWYGPCRRPNPVLARRELGGSTARPKRPLASLTQGSTGSAGFHWRPFGLGRWDRGKSPFDFFASGFINRQTAAPPFKIEYMGELQSCQGCIIRGCQIKTLPGLCYGDAKACSVRVSVCLCSLLQKNLCDISKCALTSSNLAWTL